MLIGTVIFLSLIVVLLAVPVTLTYQLSFRQTISADLRLIWAFGLVRADISPDPAKSKSRRREGASGKKKSNVLVAIRRPSFRRRVLRFISDVWRAIHKKNVQLLVRIGLGDPADTGQLWAAFGPLSGMLARVRDIRIAIVPDFLDSTFEVDSSGTIRVIPLQFAILALGLLFSPSIWRGVMLMRASG